MPPYPTVEAQDGKNRNYNNLLKKIKSEKWIIILPILRCMIPLWEGMLFHWGYTLLHDHLQNNQMKISQNIHNNMFTVLGFCDFGKKHFLSVKYLIGHTREKFVFLKTYATKYGISSAAYVFRILILAFSIQIKSFTWYHVRCIIKKKE